jgi:endoglycosylceramidase
MFHGVNVVYKKHPWYPNLDTFDVRYSFSKEDVDILADLGMNVIRLDVSWAGAEPTRGVYNQTYFEQVHRIVDMCAKRGIYVLLEWHQDLFSERYCGNGAPLWASRQFNVKGRFGYPFPAWIPFRIDNETNTANEDDCATFSSFALGYFNWHLSQAFDDLYTNNFGMRDSL